MKGTDIGLLLSPLITCVCLLTEKERESRMKGQRKKNACSSGRVSDAVHKAMIVRVPRVPWAHKDRHNAALSRISFTAALKLRRAKEKQTGSKDKRTNK